MCRTGTHHRVRAARRGARTRRPRLRSVRRRVTRVRGRSACDTEWQPTLFAGNGALRQRRRRRRRHDRRHHRGPKPRLATRQGGAAGHRSRCSHAADSRHRALHPGKCRAAFRDGRRPRRHRLAEAQRRATAAYRPMVPCSSKDIAMTLPVTVDPRYHDAVIFNLDAVLTDTDGVAVFESTINLVRKLLDVGVATAVYTLRPGGQQLLKAAGVDDLFGVCVDGEDADVLLEATRRLGVRPERSVVVDDAGARVAAAHDGGFALVIGVDRAGHADRPLGCGADVVVADLEDVAVRTGDRRMSELPDAVESYGQIIGVLGAREPVLFLDYDGTLSPIVNDPGAATLVDGAAKALESLAAQCPVAILSGRDLADIRARGPIPGLWYAGSHGFELTEPDGSYHRNEAAGAPPRVLPRA